MQQEQPLRLVLVLVLVLVPKRPQQERLPVREQERALLFCRRRPAQQQRSRQPGRGTCSLQFS